MDSKFHTNLEIIPLRHGNAPDTQVTKVGILPFIVTRQGSAPAAIKFLVMKPRSEARALGEPAFQIAKGTRRINVNGDWCDMRDDDLRNADESFFESLLATALREGQEEVGLKAANIRRLFDAGRYSFTSASKKIPKPLHMYAAEVADEKDFLPFEASTAQTRWFTVEEFNGCGRADHTVIVSEIVALLQRHV